MARALALNPKLVVLDEPVSALDVSIRAQIMNLLKDLQEKENLSYLVIAHNLATVRYMSHHVAIMYLGEIVEIGDTETMFQNPLHPYTRALQKSIPALQPKGAALYTIAGAPPDLSKPIPGCPLETHRTRMEEDDAVEHQLLQCVVQSLVSGLPV